MAEKNQKRNDILQAASILFREKSFHDTKMDEIASRAGVGKGTLYEYFRNKQEIFDETCEEYVKSIYSNIEKISGMDITFKEKIILIFRERQKLADSEHEKNPVDFVMSCKNIISERMLKTIFGYISDLYSIIVGVIEQGKKEGTVRKDIPSDVISCSIMGTIGEYFNLGIYKKNYGLNEDTIFDLLFSGFGVK